MTKLLKAVALIAVLSTGVAGPANAQTKRQEYVVVFYDDEAHSHMVGQTVHFCDGTIFRSGTITEYDEEIYYGCN